MQHLSSAFLILLLLMRAGHVDGHTGVSILLTGSDVHGSDSSYVFVHDILQVNCTLSESSRFTSHDLNITLDNEQHCASSEPCPMSGVEINSRTKQLNIPVSDGQYSGEYLCRIANQKPIIVSPVLFVFVQYPPQGVRNVSCIVHDWTSSIECRWDLGVQYIDNYDMKDPDVIVKADLSANTYCTNNMYLDSCPQEGDSLKTRCIWSGQHFLAASNYVLQVRVINRIKGKVNTTCHKITTNDIVKPSPVKGIWILEKNSSCASLAWKHTRLFTKVFRVNITVEGKNLSQIVSTTNISLCDLMPYTHYVISVETHASDENGALHGFWSDPEVKFFTTAESVPSSSFKVPEGSYKLHPCDARGKRNVTVFLKAVPRHQRNGKIIGYHLLYNGTELDVNVSSPTSALVQNVSCESNLTVSIFSRTKVGPSKINARITILPDKRKSKLDFAVDVSGEKLQAVTWNASSAVNTDNRKRGEDNVTIFWCPKNLAYVDETCEGELQWKTTAYREGRMHIPSQPQPPSHYHYGISHQGHGIIWATCLYDYQKPMKRVEANAYSQKDIISVQWTPQHCSVDYPVHVTHYLITTCQTHHCDEITHEERVEGGQSSHYKMSAEEGVEYNITVQAVDSAGRLSPSSPVITRTDTSPAEPPIWLIVCILLLLLLPVILWKCRQRCQHAKRTFGNLSVPVHMSDKASVARPPAQSSPHNSYELASSQISFPNSFMEETGMSSSTQLSYLPSEQTSMLGSEMTLGVPVQATSHSQDGVSTSSADHNHFIMHPDPSEATPDEQDHSPCQMAPSRQQDQRLPVIIRTGYTPVPGSSKVAESSTRGAEGSVQVGVQRQPSSVCNPDTHIDQRSVLNTKRQLSGTPIQITATQFSQTESEYVQIGM